MGKKVSVTVMHRETVTFDAGDLPEGMVKALVKELVTNGLDGWATCDLGSEWEVVEHVVEVK